MENIENTTTAPMAEFYKELAAAQNEFTTVRKNKVNPATHSKYADLQSVFDAVKPALNAHGFFVYQRVTSSADAVSVETLLGHRSGASLSSGVLSVPFATLQNRGTNAAQALGSARTYACRYSLCSFLGVVAEDDDDGNAAAEPKGTAPAAPAKPQPQVSPALRSAATEASQKGLNHYRAYFDALDLESRRILKSTGLHETLKNAAKAIDAEVNHE